jgi:hypothetical protein
MIAQLCQIAPNETGMMIVGLVSMITVFALLLFKKPARNHA